MEHAGGRARRYLEKHRSGIVQEEIREILELVGVEILLQLADYGAKSLCLGKNLDLRVKRLRTLRRLKLPASSAARLLSAVEDLAVSELLARAVVGIAAIG